MRPSTRYKAKLADERGAVMLTLVFFLVCLGGLLSLLLFQEQTQFLQMNTQHTADLISKGARTAGKWEYIDTGGKRQTRLYATTEEAIQSEAEIIRGAREEAEILWRLNRSSLESESRTVAARIIHQKGEKRYLYKQGIYHVQIGVDQNIPLYWGDADVELERVSQSGTYD